MLLCDSNRLILHFNLTIYYNSKIHFVLLGTNYKCNFDKTNVDKQTCKIHVKFTSPRLVIKND